MREIKMSRIKQKRTPCRRRSKNTRSQRGGEMVSCENIADDLIYNYMNDSPVKTLMGTDLLEKKTRNPIVRRLIVHIGLDNVRDMICGNGRNHKQRIDSLHAYVRHVNHLLGGGNSHDNYVSCLNTFENVLFKSVDELMLNRHTFGAIKLPVGWVRTANNQYVNMFTNYVTTSPPILPAQGETTWKQAFLEKDPEHAERAAEKALYARPMKGSSLLLDDEDLADLVSKLPTSYPKGGKTRGCKQRACKRTRKH